MKIIMKFKLLFVVLVGFLSCEFVRASENPLLDKVAVNSTLSGLMRQEIFAMRQTMNTLIEEYNKVSQDKLTRLDRGRQVPVYLNESEKSVRLRNITRTLDENRNAFLINCENTDKIFIIQRDDCWCYHVPTFICCIPCNNCCFSHVDRKIKRAQFNVLKAIAFVEEDIKRMERIER